MSYDDPGKPYRPSNGTDGMAFTETYCDRCEKDALFRETEGELGGCQLLSNSMLYELGEEGYPAEWVYNESRCPTCTAFELEGTPEARAERRERAELDKAGQMALPLPSPRADGDGE